MPNNVSILTDKCGPSHEYFKLADTALPSLGLPNITIPLSDGAALSVSMDVVEAFLPLLLILDTGEKHHLVLDTQLHILHCGNKNWLIRLSKSIAIFSYFEIATTHPLFSTHPLVHLHKRNCINCTPTCTIRLPRNFSSPSTLLPSLTSKPDLSTPPLYSKNHRRCVEHLHTMLSHRLR